MEVTFPLNYEGIDYEVTVEEEMATLLINDPVAAHEYMKNLLHASMEPKACCSNNEPGSSKEPDCPKIEAVPIWVLKKPTAHDQKAVTLMLECRKKMNHLFGDKTTKKNCLWNKIAEQLVQKGFIVGSGGGERCRQKFANLQRSYLNYVSNQKTTGTPKMDPPPFYEEIHAIIGDTPKVHPVYLQDSLEEVIAETSEKKSPKNQTANDGKNVGRREDKENKPEVLQKSKCNEKGETSPESNQDAPINRFKSGRKRKPCSKQADFIEEIKQDRQNRAEQFNFFKEHLKKSEEQRDRLLNLLEKSLLGNTRAKSKRGRRDETDIEEDSD